MQCLIWHSVCKESACQNPNGRVGCMARTRLCAVPSAVLPAPGGGQWGLSHPELLPSVGQFRSHAVPLPCVLQRQ